MSIAGILIGVLNCLVVAVVLVIVGAFIVYAAQIFQWPIPWNIQRLYLLLVLLIFLICVISLLLGSPMIHLWGHASTGGGLQLATVPAAAT